MIVLTKQTHISQTELYGTCDCCACLQMWESDDFKAHFWDLSGQIVYRAMHSFSFGRSLHHEMLFLFLQIAGIFPKRVLLQRALVVCMLCIASEL